MADLFVYRADHIGPLALDPSVGAELNGSQIDALVDMELDALMAVSSSGRQIVPASELTSAAAVDKMFETLAADVKAVTKLSVAKVYFVSAGMLSGDGSEPSEEIKDAYRRGMAALKGVNTRYVQLDYTGAAALAKNDPEALLRAIACDAAIFNEDDAPTGFVLAVDLGKVSDWDGLDTETFFKDLPGSRRILRYGVSDENFDILKSFTNREVVALGLVNPDDPRDDDTILELIDAAAEVYDADYIALTTSTGFSGSGEDVYEKQKIALNRVGTISTKWWGFAV